MGMLAYIGAAITLALGLLGLLRPETAARITAIRPVGKLGLSEIRATYGGLFTGLGAYCLIVRTPEGASVVAIAWLGAAAGRILSVAIDRNPEPKNIGAVLFEAAVGILLLAG